MSTIARAPGAVLAAGAELARGASREDEHGARVPSRFSDSAREAPEALTPTPHDLEDVRATIDTAPRTSADEERDGMQPMRALPAEFNVHRRAGGMLSDAAPPWAKALLRRRSSSNAKDDQESRDHWDDKEELPE